jgi:hypothetical protein
MERIIMAGRLLIAYSNLCTHVTTTREYLEAFARHSSWDVGYVNVAQGAELRFDLNEFDAVLHSYCARVIFEDYVSPSYKEALKSFRGVRAFAVQDEYDRTNLVRDAIRELGFHIVLTCVPQESLEYVYPSAMFPGTDFITVLTGYVSETIGSGHGRRVPLRDRATVIGYRGNDLGLRYGRLGTEKLEIGRRMREVCQARGIAHDIEWAPDKRIYGEAWHQFIRSCRTVLGSESGSNVFDFDGSIEKRYQELKAQNLFDCESFLAHIDARESEIDMGQISPRVFEAAAQWTPMILFKGRYSGAIRPGEHYVELEKDFSNVDAVLRQTEDLDALEAMATRAHDHLIKSGSFSQRGFVEKLERAIARKHREIDSAGPLRSAPYTRRSESVTDFYAESEVIGEYPTPMPQGAVYYFHKYRLLEARTYKQELDRLRAGYGEEVQRLHSRYAEEVRQRDSEIERLHKVYLEAIEQRDVEIKRLHSVYGEAIQRLNADYARGRLAAVARYVRSSFRTAARRMPGARVVLRSLYLLGRVARDSKTSCGRTTALSLAWLRSLSGKRAVPEPSSPELPSHTK